jgi:hypothetical protein
MSLSTLNSQTASAALELLPRTAASHFKIYFFAAALHVLEQLSRNLGSLDEVLEQFPFLRDYLDEAKRNGISDFAAGSPEHDWLRAVRAWECSVEGHLPIRALRDTLALEDATILLLFTIGLIEEDPRFGFVIECAQPVSPQQHRPTLGLLMAWWRDAAETNLARSGVRTLLDNGLLQVLNADAPRLQWVFQSPPAVWDALRGEMVSAPAPWLRFIALSELPSVAEIVLSDAVRRSVESVPALLRLQQMRGVIVRGPQHNGRRTIVRSIARSLSRGVLELRGPIKPEDDRWPLVGALATLADALPTITLDLGLGETCEIPALRAFDGPIAVVLGKYGSVTGPAIEGAATISVDIPGPDERRSLWEQAATAGEPHNAIALAQRFRMTSGNIRAAAALARSYALLEQRRTITSSDVRIACRPLHRDLETLATFVPATGGWENMGVSASTREELRNLESRCRHREQLRANVGPGFGQQLNCGVRALFSGPSGTGKTMAARILASTLQMDLYRLDLPSVVNKYIGETEKSLQLLFSRAEELDIVLLIDEGDSLMTNRTAVSSSNDRYANLETNFLLQRLESFEGVLVVTTNAVNRIDAAFSRRMDVVVDFHAPGPHERWAIWQLHLPLEHSVDARWLQDAAVRCAMTGGQIRNAVLHGSIRALDEGRKISTAHLEEAVHREYRKSGAVCPLPQMFAGG